MTPERRNIMNQVLDLRQPDLTVITEKVAKIRNVAAIVRSCDAVGIAKIHCVLGDEPYRTFRGTSASADKYVDSELHEYIASPIKQLKAKGYKVYAAHLCDDALEYTQVDFTQPSAIVMGTEGDGVSEEAVALSDDCIYIPMMGMVESLNVSAASAIILSEAQRQRQAAGLYDQPRLSSTERKRLFFKWAYRRLANFCDERSLGYPPLDDKGDLLPGSGRPV